MWNPTENTLVSGLVLDNVTLNALDVILYFFLFLYLHRSMDSTARIWEIPSDLSTAKSNPPLGIILPHGEGTYKDVTTLEWNVR